jgi:hypothetical protein
MFHHLSRRGWAVIDTPKPQEQAGALYFNFRNLPQSPSPLHIPDGKEMVSGIRIRDNRNGVVYSDAIVDFLTITERPRISDNISVIFILGNDILKNPRSGLYAFAIPHFTVKLCHGG